MRHAARQRFLRRVTVLVFAVSLCLFAAAPLGVYYRRAAGVAAVPPVTAEETGARRTALLCFHRDGALTAAVAVCGDTRTHTVTARGYPAHTEVTYGTRVTTLADCYTAAGAAGAGTALAQVTGETYGAALSLSITAAGRLAVATGSGLPYTLTEAVGTLPAGTQTLTAVQITDLLAYTGWAQQESGQATIHAELTAAAINRALTPSCDLQRLFTQLAAACEERLSIAQFAAVRGDWERLAAAGTGTLCTAETAAGIRVGTADAPRYLLTE